MRKIGLFKKKVETRANEPQTLDAILRSELGVDAMTKSQALNIPAVASCVEFISNIVSSLPIKLYEESENEVKEIKDDIRVTLLNDDTGDTLNGQQMKKALVEDYLLKGNGYVYMNREYNNVKSLHYVDELSVGINFNCDPIFKAYDILVNGTKYRDFEFIKITRKTKNGAQGVGIISENEKQLAIAYNTLVFENNLVKTGGNKKGFLQSEKKVIQSILDELKSAFNKLYSNNSENVIVLNDGIKFQEASQSSVEMQLNENKKTNAEEICRLFNLSLDVTSGKCTDEERGNAVKNAIIPVLVAIETALNKDYLLAKEKKSKYWAFDTKEMLKGDIVKRFTAYQIAIQANIMQIDEARYMEDLKPLGLDFIKIGLQDVLFYPKTGMVYTPNTNQMISMGQKTIDTNGLDEKPIETTTVDK